MDRAVFGSKYFGELTFDVVVKLLQKLLDNITERFPEESLRLLFKTLKPGKEMDVYVERIDQTKSKKVAK